MLSEIRQTKEDKHSMFSLVWDVDLKRLRGCLYKCVYLCIHVRKSRNLKRSHEGMGDMAEEGKEDHGIRVI